MMKRFTILAVALVSVTFALDLETVQKNSNRHHGYPSPAMVKRKIEMPSYADIYNDFKSDPSAQPSDPQQYYRRVQELLANIVSQRNRVDPTWLESIRQRDSNLRQMTDIRPPYDQAYSQNTQEDSLRWVPPSPQLVRPTVTEKQQPTYRSHKQLPYSTRVPQEEMMKKRSVDSNSGDRAKIAESVYEKEKIDGSNAAETLKHVNTTSGNNKMSPDQFQQWLTDEYYRNMAMSFATMRKKRSLLEPGDDVVPSTNRDEEVAFERLRMMEDSLLQDALHEIIYGTSGSKQKPQVLGKLDVAHDIENLKKILQSLLADTQKLKVNNEAEIMTALKNRGRNYVDPKVEDPIGCPELRLLMNGCSALRGMFPPDPIREQFVNSCNWHEVCYSCGAQHGISADQCDRSFLLDMKFLCGQLGSCNPNLTSLLLTPLHRKRVYFKQSTLPICAKPCLVNFLARN